MDDANVCIFPHQVRVVKQYGLAMHKATTGTRPWWLLFPYRSVEEWTWVALLRRFVDVEAIAERIGEFAAA